MSFSFKLALRYLSGRKLRTFLTTLAVVFGVMIMFGLNAVLPTMQKALDQSLTASADQADLTITGETRGVFPTDALDRVGDAPGIQRATMSLVRPVVVPPAEAPKDKEGQPISSFMLTGLDPGTAPDVLPVPIKKGRFLSPDDKNTVLISAALAERAGLKVGDELRVPAASGTIEFSIVGVTDKPAVPGAEELLVPLPAAQALFNQPDKINTIDARVAAGADGEKVRRDVLKALGAGYKVGRNELGNELLASMRVGQFIYNVFGVLVLVMGMFIIFNTFRTIVAERRRAIAMLRALGAAKGTIRGLILTESLLQGLIGTAVGLAAGYAMAVAILAAMKPLYDQVAHISLGRPVFTATNIIVSVGLGVGVTVLGGLMPAWAATRVAPLEAMRPIAGDTAWKMGKGAVAGVAMIILAVAGLVSGSLRGASIGAVLFLAGLVLVGPALVKPIATVFGRLLTLVFAREGQIAQGNLTRQPSRAAITASAMMISLAILIALAGMITSLEAGMNKYLDRSFRSTYLLMPQSLVLGGGNVGSGPELLDKLRATPGVSSATGLRQATTKTGKSDLQVVGVDPDKYPKLSGLAFTAGDPSAAYLALSEERAVIANGIFASANSIKVGQHLTLKTPEGDKKYKVVGIGSDYLNMKLATGYISQDNLRRDFHETTDLLLMVDREKGADSGQVSSALKEVVKDYPAFTLFSTEELRKTQEELVSGVLKGMYVLILMLAVPSLIALVNTLGINVIERTREIGMLRAIGATRRQVRKLIVGESLLLASIGIAFGILSGLWLGYILVGGASSSGFVIPYFFPYSGILATIAFGLIMGVVAALLPARHAARLDIVAALHYE